MLLALVTNERDLRNKRKKVKISTVILTVSILNAYFKPNKEGFLRLPKRIQTSQVFKTCEVFLNTQFTTNLSFRPFGEKSNNSDIETLTKLYEISPKVEMTIVFKKIRFIPFASASARL